MTAPTVSEVIIFASCPLVSNVVIQKKTLNVSQNYSRCIQIGFFVQRSLLAGRNCHHVTVYGFFQTDGSVHAIWWQPLSDPAARDLFWGSITAVAAEKVGRFWRPLKREKDKDMAAYYHTVSTGYALQYLTYLIIFLISFLILIYNLYPDSREWSYVLHSIAKRGQLCHVFPTMSDSEACSVPRFSTFSAPIVC